MSDTKKLKNGLKKLFEEELGGLFKKLGEEEKAFFAEKAGRIAEEQMALALATTPAAKRKHRLLLQALALSVETEIIDLKLKISAKNREFLAKALRLVVRALIAAL